MLIKGKQGSSMAIALRHTPAGQGVGAHLRLGGGRARAAVGRWRPVVAASPWACTGAL